MTGKWQITRSTRSTRKHEKNRNINEKCLQFMVLPVRAVRAGPLYAHARNNTQKPPFRMHASPAHVYPPARTARTSIIKCANGFTVRRHPQPACAYFACAFFTRAHSFHSMTFQKEERGWFLKDAASRAGLTPATATRMIRCTERSNSKHSGIRARQHRGFFLSDGFMSGGRQPYKTALRRKTARRLCSVTTLPTPSGSCVVTAPRGSSPRTGDVIMQRAFRSAAPSRAGLYLVTQDGQPVPRATRTLSEMEQTVVDLYRLAPPTMKAAMMRLRSLLAEVKS